MVNQMKLYLLSALLLICFKLSAETPYELPRSSVIELEEKSTGRVYPLFIQLPVSYTSQTDNLYPVIYLTDAHYTFPVVAGATRFPMNTGVMQHAIIVAVSYEKGSVGTNSRTRDYTPTVTKAWKQQTGNAIGHKLFLRDTVIPFIEHHYRASKKDRTFVGNSLGALFGAYILFSEPDLFSNYILGSPSVWFDHHVILALQAVKPKLQTKVYLSVGEYETPAYGEGQDMVKGAIQLKEKIAGLGSADIELKFSTISGASHVTAFPTTAIQGLDWVYGIKRQ
ncbi:Putative hydrolase of alpha/beta superfamily [Rheinheimera sp. A13L]|nr:Putative hydrolase of alpha/beta superfamily [Rheinheimera sp. A13L]